MILRLYVVPLSTPIRRTSWANSRSGSINVSCLFKMMQGDEEDVMVDVSLAVPQTSSPSRISFAVAAANPTCRSIRWCKQLLHFVSGQLDQDAVPTTNSICDIEAIVLSHYENLKEQYSELLRLLDDIDDAETEPVTDKSDEKLSSLDPLSAMLQEDDAKVNRQKEIAQLYEQDRKRNKGRRGLYMPDEPQNGDATANAIAYKQLISKDLLRLSSPHRQAPPETNINILSTVRLRQLTYLLYLFAISHPEAGYLQGMHEIASYCLYALEKDVESLLQERNVAITAALSYSLTESIISFLYIAYDVSILSPRDSTINTKASSTSYQAPPLVQMSNRILQALSLVDTALFSILQSSSQAIPYQLIFTKWIRLLFSREVVTSASMTHADTVIFLWDALFDASYILSQQLPSPNLNVPSLQTVAELFCVARLWHHTNAIQHLHYSSRTADSNFLLHWLMNIPPEPITEVQKILPRMNYLISLQFITNSSSDDIKAELLLLPPLNEVPPDILAMTSPSMSRSHNGDALPKQSTTNISQSLWDGNGSGTGSSFLHAAAAALSQKDHSKTLSSLTETIASKTQSIQRLIVQEWENVQAQLIDSPMYDCGGDAAACEQRKLEEEQSIYNLDYYGSNASNSSERVYHQVGKGKWSEQLQRHLSTIHQYVVRQEQRNQNYADGDSRSKRLIWDALAELQSLQQEINRNGL
jgi:Rab-GTPase-TBC domain